MSLVDRVSQELKGAMRDRDETRLAAIRAIRNEIIKLSKTAVGSSVTDDAVIKLVKSQIKQRQDAIAMFQKGNRPDLVSKEQAEIGILQQFLPVALSDAELNDIVAQAISDTGATNAKQMGAVMKAAIERIQAMGKDADNRTLSAMVKAKLG